MTLLSIKYFALLLGLCLFINNVYSNEALPTWIAISDVQAGIITIVQSNTYQQANKVGPYVVTYSPAFTSSPQTGVAISTVDITPVPSYLEYLVNINDPSNLAQLKINMNYVSIAWKTFKVSYIAIGSSISYLKVDYMSLQFSSPSVLATGTGTRTLQSTFTLHITINSSSTLSIQPFLTGLKMASSSLKYKFGLSFSKNSDTVINYNATAEVDTLITEITSYILIYDLTLGQSTETIYLDYLPLVGSNSAITSSLPSNHFSNNILAGINQFSFSSGFGFDFQTSTLTLALTSGTTYTSITLSLWSFRKRTCPGSTPYYEKNNNKCYDTCPAGYLPIASDNYCKSCSNYITYCNLCSSSTVCTQCKGIMTLSNPTTCVCPTGQFVNVSASSYCSLCDSSCKACNSNTSTNCLSCFDGLYLSSSKCLACDNTCLTCTSLTTCQTCKDGYYLSSASCLACNSNCKTCTGPNFNDCHTCDEVYRTFSSNQCACKSGDQDVSTGECINHCTGSGCINCPVNNNTCTECKPKFTLSGSRCKCPDNYYYNSTDVDCYVCDKTCSMCSGPSNNQCTACDSSLNRKLNSTTLKCDCSVTYYAPHAELTCIKEPMTSCPDYFTYNSSSGICDDICGDGKVFDLQCDDGNLDNLDGCNQYCRIEQQFNCQYGDENSPSICSYNGSIIFKLNYAHKQIYQNQITILYNLYPENLKIYQRFSDFSSYLNYNDTSVTIVRALYSNNSQLSITLKYNQSLVEKKLKMAYVPPVSPYTFALNSSSVDWNPKVSNGLSIAYYKESIYNTVDLLYKISFSITIISLTIFFLSLFFRKMIGIELMNLIQISFLSYTVIGNAHPYSAVITQWKYVFGYNQLKQIQSLDASSSSQISSVYSALGYSGVFGQNFNVMLFVILGIYILSIILFILSKIIEKSVSKKMKEASFIFARQIAFGMILFQINNIVTSYGIQIETHRIWEFIPQYSGTFKIISIIIILVNYFVYILTYKQSIESYVFYKKREKISQLQPLFVLTKNIILSTGIYLHIYLYENILYGLISLQVIYFIFLIYLRPFKRKIDILRNLTIQGVLIYILVSRYLESYFINHDKPGDWSVFMDLAMPLEYALLGVSLIISIISLMTHLFKSTSRQSQINPEQMISEADFKQQRKPKQQVPMNLFGLFMQQSPRVKQNIYYEKQKQSNQKRVGKKKYEELLKNNDSTSNFIGLNSRDIQISNSKRRLNEFEIDENEVSIIQIDE